MDESSRSTFPSTGRRAMCRWSVVRSMRNQRVGSSQDAHDGLPPAGGAGDAAGQAGGGGVQGSLVRVALQVAPQHHELLPGGQQGLRLLPGEGLPPAELLIQGPLSLGPGEGGAEIAQLELHAPPPPVLVDLGGEGHVHPVAHLHARLRRNLPCLRRELSAQRQRPRFCGPQQFRQRGAALVQRQRQ